MIKVYAHIPGIGKKEITVKNNGCSVDQTAKELYELVVKHLG